MNHHRRGGAALAFTLIAALAPAARGQAPPRPGAPDDARTVELPLDVKPAADDVVRTSAEAIVRAAATTFGAHAWIDPQAAEVKVSFRAGGPLTWGALKVILDQHEVVLVESQPTDGGAWVMRAHLRRNLNQREGPAWRIVDSTGIPASEEIVTVVIDVAHGQGNSIFAVVRGLLCRDINRIGNILYIQGAEKIVIVDLASKARYYAAVVARLDVPTAGLPTVVLHLQNASPERVAAELEEVLSGPANAPGCGLRAAADARTRQVILTGDEATLAAAERLGKALDAEARDVRAQVVVRFYEVTKAGPSEVFSALRAGVDALERAGGTRGRIEVLPATGKRIAVAAHADDFPRVEEMLRALDGP